MDSRPRTKMSVENRAKQFMPFAALKGLPEALEEREKESAVPGELQGVSLEELEHWSER